MTAYTGTGKRLPRSGAATGLVVPSATIPAVEALRRISHTYPEPTLVDGRPDGWWPTAVDESDWGHVRVVVGGTDVTFIRGARTRLRDLQLGDFGEIAASLVVAGASLWDLGQSGFEWLAVEKSVSIRKHHPDSGAYVSTLFTGVVGAVDVGDQGVDLSVDGTFAGVAGMIPHIPKVTERARDMGTALVMATRRANGRWNSIRDTPIGITTRKRGSPSQTLLDFCQELLALAQTDDGERWALQRVPDRPRTYQLGLVDRTTEHVTIYPNAPGVTVRLRQDLSEVTRRIMGEGVNHNGGRWRGVKFPNIGPETIPTYPGAPLGIGSTGVDVEVWQQEMSSDGYEVGTELAIKSGLFTTVEAEAAEELQRDAGLPVTGIVDEDTWNATWSNGASDLNLGGSYIAPLVEDSRVKRWLTSSNGSILARNPGYDGTVIPVGRTISYGENISKKLARRSARQVLARDKDPDWYGEITLYGVDPPEMSRYDITEHMNARVAFFGGDPAGILVHVAGVRWAEAESGHQVILTVDTKARDLLSLTERIQRDREARQDPARKAINQLRRSTQVRDAGSVWDAEGGFGVFPDRDCTGGEWNVFRVPAGKYGTLVRVRFDVAPATRFCLAVFGAKPYKSRLTRLVPDPLTEPSGDDAGRLPWDLEGIQDDLRDMLFVEAFGGPNQAGGYYPGYETHPATGEPTGHALTGRMNSDSGTQFALADAPKMFVAVWPEADCTIEGRLYLLADE